MAKYLVTGGAGFIGSNIVERLLKDGHSVRVVDNFSTGKFENIQKFISNIEFICGDLIDFTVAQKAVEGIEYISHQAAVPSVPRSIQDPITSNHSMVSATVNLFKAAVESKTVKRIVQAASSAAYGDSPELPKREDMLPDPLSPYAAAKLAQEYYAKVFYNSYGLEILSLRYFNVFGPKQDPFSFYSAVIPKFLNIMLQGKAPVIYGDGLNSRDFVYIDNVVEANLLACSCKWPGISEVINIGCGESISLNDLVKMLNSILKTNIEAVHDKPAIGDVKHSVSDISKAKSVLGFEPRVGIYDGLVKLVDWWKKKD